MDYKTHYDLIILGAGPAGMTAGVYAARKQLDTLIITENVGGQATWSSDVENYLGYIYISGVELVQKFEEHLKKFDVKVEFTTASKLSLVDGGFKVDTADSRTFFGRAVIVATGKSPRLLDVPGEKEFTGRGVTYCATCDGPLYSGKAVAVVGGGNSGLDAAVQLIKICPKVYIIEFTDQLRADQVMIEQVTKADNVEILVSNAVKEIKGDTFVHSLIVEDRVSLETRTLDVEGVFVEVGLTPNTDFIKGLVELNKYGEIPVDCGGHTGIPGLYAGGDVTTVPEKQIIIAAGDGAKAALGAYSYLVRQPISDDWSSKTS
ncbi:MAG: FAD-dependent oxidoreductase [Armatimonadota bacterium]|nr:FAD-dependent oxidoreductase [bacterium]